MNRDKLVEHLHSEIASRDERIGELENDASYYAARYEDVREELEALKAANLELQIHFDIMKAELEGTSGRYAVVPIDPTQEMLDAFHVAISVWLDEIGEDQDVYKAMISAYVFGVK